MTNAVLKQTTIQERAVILVLTINAFGNRRQVELDDITNLSDRKALLNVTKRLLDADSLKAISSLDGEIRRWVELQCVPSPFKAGTYTLPIGLISRVEAQMEEFQERRQALINKAVRELPDLIDKAERELNDIKPGLFNRDDYPTESQFRKAYGLSYQYVKFSAPEQLRGEVFEREREKIEKQWADATETIQQALREAAAEMVGHLVDRLDYDGKKPKVFRDTAVTKLQEFLDTFKQRNITDDVQLDALVDKAKRLIAGVKPNQLRDSLNTRDLVRRGFETIKKQLDTMIVDKPKRAIEFGD